MISVTKLARLGVALAWAGGGVQRLPAATAPDPRNPVLSGELVYDRDYPFIHYSEAPVHNAVARLQQRLDDGTLKLTATPAHGYLESVLAALNIDPDSQGLVFSKTSLQIDVISPATPRAVYFNDDTYVAWVQKTGSLEIVTMDADRGPVFYTLSAADTRPNLQREAPRCLTCHDSYSELGGGVPRFLFESVYEVQGKQLIPDAIAQETSQSTPIAQRWGGWYVTGDDGGTLHLGNIQTPVSSLPVSLDEVRRGTLKSLSSLLDTSPYLRDTSDAVALLVLEHQITVHNQIIRVNYKSRTLLNRELPGSDPTALRWSQLPTPVQTRLDAMLRSLVEALLMSDAAPLPNKVAGSNGYVQWFQDQGPKDSRGRSLRELELHSRTFRYPLSYLIYSEGFDALPLFVRDRVYARLAQALHASVDGQAAFEILLATKPEFAHDIAAVRD
jgi:hypothetical protein